MLLTISTTACIFLFFAITIMVINKKNKTTLKNKQRIGLQWLILLREFLSHTQQHRGLTTGYLNGDFSLEQRINQLHTQLKKDIQHIETIDEWVSENDNWNAIKDHWQRLKDGYKHNTIENNLTQHGCLIRNILYLIEEMAEDHQLLRLENIDQFGVDFVWRNLLETTEYMGQARALGTGISASQSCCSVDKIKLNYLKDKITESGKLITKTFPNSDSVHTNIILLLNTIESNFFQKSPTDTLISANEYFDLATKALNGVYAEYDSTVKQFDGQVAS